MSLTPAQIHYIAKLARLKIDDERIASYTVQLNRIMNLIEEMNRIDTDGVAPMSHPQDIALRLREDIAVAEDCRETYQEMAPASRHGLYLVPKVIE